MNRELEESLKNSYLVRRRLSALRKLPGDACYILNIDKFMVRMYTNAEFSIPANRELPNLTDYKAVTVEVWEQVSSSENRRVEVYLNSDPRFESFIEDNRWSDQDWKIRTGSHMPVPVLCDLIKYIDRIAELNAFH